MNPIILDDSERDRFQAILTPRNAVVIGSEGNGLVADLTPADSLAVLAAALDAFGVTDKAELSAGELVVFEGVETALLAAIAADGGLGDIVQLGSGNDRISARSGNDVVFGGDGNDHLSGELGLDVLVGGFGNDVMHGGAGDDILLGNAGNDVLVGGDGDDSFFGGPGNNVIDGGQGDDEAAFDGLLSEHAITLIGGARGLDRWLVSGPDGISLLRDVEKLVFDDGVVDLASTPFVWDVADSLFTA
jgi:Ca2+-binding RTX toxin-like protein